MSTMTATTGKDSMVSPLSPEEIVAMDSAKGRFGLKKSLQRSISFMKKSLSRSNSNDSLSAGSLHSTASTTESTTMAGNESFAGNDSFGGNESFVGSCDPFAPRRSCMKGTRTGNIDQRIRFRKSKDKVRMIEPYFEFAPDLWYTEKEKYEIFAKPGVETVTEALNAEKYMKTLAEARKVVFPQSYTEGVENFLVKPDALTTKEYDEIVQGRVYGFAGLEQYCSTLKHFRRKHIKNTVLAIISAYYDCLEEDHLSKDEVSKKVRSVSKSLTKSDRYWATAMGNADFDATRVQNS